MSIQDAFETQGIDLAKYMNPPEEWDGQCLIKTINDSQWVCCPFCEKKTLLIKPNTKISNLTLKCTGSHCKKKFEVNI